MGVLDSPPRAGMSAVVYLEEAVGIDFRIPLSGRKRRVAKQFLNRAKVTAIRQEMGRETVA